MTGPLIYLVACEPSGDALGAQLMRALTAETDGRARFCGIGGPEMQAAGLRSLFDPSELALLGILEVIPKFARVLARVRESVADIERSRPDVLVTIDSWGFTGRIHQRLARRGSPIPRVRYVGPQVWAWRPGRARQLARWIHRLLVLFPFEPPHFTRYGLATDWVGHPVIESGADRGDAARFRGRHGIPPEATILTVLPGSRAAEVAALLPMFRDTIGQIAAKVPGLHLAVPTVPGVEARVRAGVADWPWPTAVVVAASDRFDAFAASTAALAASGTVTLELALAGLPHVVAYRLHPVSAWLLRRLVRTRYVNLINVLLDRAVVSERLQQDCRPDILADDVNRLLIDPAARSAMRAQFKQAVAKLAPPGVLPSQAAARAVLAMVAAQPSG
ncbi:MAG: lipid-A-disaccharide synthase [Rhodospirillaceae bacterium]|nr:lipid-A-disaccharide synthase [Rhodospirillaceae bacterium]